LANGRIQNEDNIGYRRLTNPWISRKEIIWKSSESEIHITGNLKVICKSRNVHATLMADLLYIWHMLFIL
jgi:hypothetical protein